MQSKRFTIIFSIKGVSSTVALLVDVDTKLNTSMKTSMIRGLQIIKKNT